MIDYKKNYTDKMFTIIIFLIGVIGDGI